jgi:tetratricopeptide (TPR) repeat protein
VGAVFESLLRKARDLKRRSRTLRDQGKYAEAEELLCQAIVSLEEPVSSVAEKLPPGEPAAPDIRELAAELADCLGSLGGVRRRDAEAIRQDGRREDAQARYQAAIEAFERGLALEQDDRFRIANSYNLVQRVVVPVLTSPESLGGSELQKKLGEILSVIERQLATTRPADAWAYSDLGLVQLLGGDEAAANWSWDKMDDLKPTRNVYTSGLPVLESLAAVVSDAEPFRRAAERFRAAPPEG